MTDEDQYWDRYGLSLLVMTMVAAAGWDLSNPGMAATKERFDSLLEADQGAAMRIAQARCEDIFSRGSGPEIPGFGLGAIVDGN